MTPGPQRAHRGLWLFIPILILATVAFGAHKVAANNDRLVTLSVDGVRQGFSTDAKTVSDVLARAKVRLSDKDLVEPAPATEINTEVFYVNVYRAKPVVVVDGDREIKVETPYQNPKLIAEKSAGLTVAPEDEYQTEPIRDIIGFGTIGYRLVVVRSVPITLSVDGNTFEVRTQAKTVGDLLKEKNITLAAEDVVVPVVDTSITKGMNVKVLRAGKEVVSEEQVIPFTVQTIFDNNKPAGYEEVTQQGVNGKRLVTYEIKYDNGQEVDRSEVSSVEITKMTPKIVIRSATFAGGVWAALRACECGGNYGCNTGNGFYGAYQFTLSTWSSNAPADYANTRPDLAPPEIQDAAAQNLQSRRGWGPWPACARKLGLL